ncbi:uncharacterized protein LOC132042424 [Lycium ferocissimum]|uniref:uncharacterized protein LOC132042424 n=1 Tax=Lycium ferocissimum TaxID=112874 RepID=UPI002815C8F0|nr:uncharacterized protein LOC132042424 [Lycium ferocissimum]
MEIEMTQEESSYELDVGNLMASYPHHNFVSPPSSRVRQSHKKPTWILPENYNKLLHYWATNERFLQLSDIGKKARNSTKGGSLHTSGAMSQEAVRRKLELKRGMPVPQDEAFKITHVKKKANANDPNRWCEERAK